MKFLGPGVIYYAFGKLNGAPAIKIGLAEAVRICDALGVDLVDMLGDAEPVLVTETKWSFKPHAAPR